MREHVRRAAAAGADLRFEERALGWEADGRGVRVTTTRGDLEAERLVVCPGAWAPSVLADLGVPLRVTRQVVFWFAPVGRPGGVRGGATADLHLAAAPDAQPYGFPCIGGPDGGVKVALFRGGRETDPDDARPRVARRRGGPSWSTYLRPLLPTMPGRFLRAVACIYTTTPDQHFVISTHPGHDNVMVAAGFSGHGFKFVPVVGEILADLALEGGTRHPVGLFDPTRFAQAQETVQT